PERQALLGADRLTRIDAADHVGAAERLPAAARGAGLPAGRGAAPRPSPTVGGAATRTAAARRAPVGPAAALGLLAALRRVVVRRHVLERQPEGREGSVLLVEGGVGVDDDGRHPDLRLRAVLVGDAHLRERLRRVVRGRLGGVAVAEALVLEVQAVVA